VARAIIGVRHRRAFISDDLAAKAEALPERFMNELVRPAPTNEMNEQARTETAAIVIDVTSMTVRLGDGALASPSIGCGCRGSR